MPNEKDPGSLIPGPVLQCSEVLKPGSNRALAFYLSMILSENRCPLFGIMLYDRVRERIMKESKVNSATCHQRYSSDRKAIMLS